MALDFRPLLPTDAAASADLTRAAFLCHIAQDWQPEAQERFLSEMSTATLQADIEGACFTAGAFEGLQLIGFILLPRPNFVRLLFVDSDHMGRGLGRQLWEAARTHLEAHHPTTGTVELNASPFALGFYRRLGFAPLSAEYTLKGSRVTRMACWLPARLHGAEL
ncbi:GNAT family N-acetyltransferase [Roseateles paludis]|jgi:GNAT superfamily N-acetyltransferase|uniref:GNAT family N-acetyltransferase n=1 Tax=Roseateles paludis TaxID=3145238 RepID=A0ABV0G0F5_9BURK